MQNWRSRKVELVVWLLCLAVSVTTTLEAAGHEFKGAIAAPLLVWITAPYLGLWIFVGRAMRSANDRAWVWFGRVCAVASLAFTSFAYLDAVYLHVSSTSGLVFVFVPVWLAVGGAASVAAGRALLGKGVVNANARCRTCGYDLTGNVSGVCPECGKTRPPNSADEGPQGP